MVKATATITTTITATAQIVFTPAAGSCTYQNSDNSFNETILSGVTFVAPDVTFTDNVGTANVIPANLSFTASTLPIAYVQLGFPENPTVYTVGDSGTQLANGTYDKTTLGIRPILIDNDTLSPTTLNAFGNQLVWTDDQGGTDFAGNGNYAINHYANIGVSLIGRGLAANWAAAITDSQTATDYIYNDWRLMSLSEACYFFRVDGISGLYDYSPLNALSLAAFWWTCESGFTLPNTFAVFIETKNIGTADVEKISGLVQSFLIRNHY